MVPGTWRKRPLKVKLSRGETPPPDAVLVGSSSPLSRAAGLSKEAAAGKNDGELRALAERAGLEYASGLSKEAAAGKSDGELRALAQRAELKRQAQNHPNKDALCKMLEAGQIREVQEGLATVDLESGIKRGPWTDEERDTLVRLIEEHGRKFIIIAPIMKRKADDVRNMTKQNKSLQKLLEDAGLGANKRGSYKKRKG